MNVIYMHRTKGSCGDFTFPGIDLEYPYRALWNRDDGQSVVVVPHLPGRQAQDVDEQFALMQSLDLGAHELVCLTCDDGDLYEALFCKENQAEKERVLELLGDGYRLSPFCTREGNEEALLERLGVSCKVLNLAPSSVAGKMGDKVLLRHAAERTGCTNVFPRFVVVSGAESLVDAVELYLKHSESVFLKLPGWASGKGIAKVSTVDGAYGFASAFSDHLERVIVEVDFGEHVPMSFGRMIQGDTSKIWGTQQLCQGSSHKGNIIGCPPHVGLEDQYWMQLASEELFQHFFMHQHRGIAVFDAMKSPDGRRALCEANVRETASSSQLRLHEQIEQKTGLVDSTSICLSVVLPGPLTFMQMSNVLDKRLGWDASQKAMFLPSLFTTAHLGYASFHAQAQSYTEARRVMTEAFDLLGIHESEYVILPQDN
jgi:hypothetical protein